MSEFYGRTQSVVINDQHQHPIHFIWSPLLFINYINDVPSVVKYCKIQLHADDTLLYVSTSFISYIESMLSEDLRHIIEWLNNNFLYLNYSKTKVMLTGTHQRLACLLACLFHSQSRGHCPVTSLSV